MYSYVLPTMLRYRSKSSRFITTVPRQSLGWNDRESAFCRFSSRNRCTWFSVSFISPKGDTLPGSSPRYFIIRSGEANESFPHEGSPRLTSDSFSRCSRSCMARSWSLSKHTR